MFGYNKFSHFRGRIADFLARHPAFCAGVCFFVGVRIALTSLSAADLLFFLLIAPFLKKKRAIFCLSLIAISACATAFRVVPPHQLQKESSSYLGQASGYVVDRRQSLFHGKPSWMVQFYVTEFVPFDGSAACYGITAAMHCPTPCPLMGGARYSFPSRLVADAEGRLSLHMVQPGPVRTGDHFFSIVEWRLSMRRLLERIFAGLFSDIDVRHVAGALTFALYKDDLLQEAMHRCGVEHVLAVSGFHFGIIAALIFALGRALEKMAAQSLFKRVRSWYLGPITSLVLLTGYMAIIGPLPSVLRAYTACCLALLASCLHRHISGIQALGCGLIVAVFFDPLSTLSLGFELSFLSTLAIVIFSKIVHSKLGELFPQRSLSQVAQFSLFDQGLRCLLKLCIPIVSISLAVLLLLIPYELTFLQDFSSLGPLYNMLIPLMFSLAMPLILFAVLLSPLPWLAGIFASCAAMFLKLGLYLVHHAPVLRYSLMEGAVLPQLLGRAIIVIIILGGISAISDETADCSWKACL